jgi:Cof subfamily protein (haloacid dehalogenase superfamily)
VSAASTDLRLLVLDLDGTTLTRARTINPIDIAAIAALRARGVGVTIATGRLWSGTQRIARRLGVRGPVACMNGSELRDAETGAVLHERYLGAEERATLARNLRSRGLARYVFAAECVHHDDAGEPYLQYLRSWSDRVALRDASELDAQLRHRGDTLAVAASGSQTAVDRVASALRDELPEHVEAIVFPSNRSGRLFCKARDRRDDKGTALAPLAAAAGLKPENCVAVGDWINDEPMLRAAGLSFAMAQAPVWVQRAAQRVCEASSDTGGAVAEVARRVWGVEVAAS